MTVDNSAVILIVVSLVVVVMLCVFAGLIILVSQRHNQQNLSRLDLEALITPNSALQPGLYI